MTTRPRVRFRPLTVAGLLICAAVGCYLYGRPFDRDAWHQRDVVRGDRQRMVNGLTIRHLPRLTHEQVVELLGPSDDPSVFHPGIRQYPKWDLVYMLGVVDPFWMIGPGVMEALVIRFGPDGRVKDYRVGHEWKFRPSSGGLQEP